MDERRARRSKREATLVDPDGAERACAASRAGQRIDRFLLRELLGVGGMAAVYRAHDPALGRDLALKVTRSSGILRSDRHGRARFLLEARLLASLRDPRIVRIHDVGGHGEELWLALELLEGTPLSQAYIEGRLTVFELYEIAEQLLQALMIVHRAEIVHRDVTPNNVFVLSQSDGGVRVKLLDFGIAKLLTTAPCGRLTTHGSVIGTPHYMAPEQARCGHVDGRADLWSVAALLYQGLTGVTPYQGASPTEVISRILTERPVSLASIRPDLPAPLVAAVERALTPDPALRWATSHRMLSALRDAREATLAWRGWHLELPVPSGMRVIQNAGTTAHAV